MWYGLRNMKQYTKREKMNWSRCCACIRGRKNKEMCRDEPER